MTTETQSEFLVETSMREDLFQAVGAYAKSGQDLPSVGEDKRFLDRLLRDFKRNGLALQGEAKDRLKAIKKKLSENSIEFSKNLNNDTSFIACTEEVTPTRHLPLLGAQGHAGGLASRAQEN